MDDELTPDDPVVRYTVREMLARIDGKIDSLTTSVALKADKADLDRMEQRLDGHDGRLTAIETWRHDKEVAASVYSERDQRNRAKWSRRERWFAALTAAAVAAGTILLAVHP